jgi:hypothetical protein
LKAPKENNKLNLKKANEIIIKEADIITVHVKKYINGLQNKKLAIDICYLQEITNFEEIKLYFKCKPLTETRKNCMCYPNNMKY